MSTATQVNDDGANATASANAAATGFKFGMLRLIEFTENGTQPCWDEGDVILRSFNLVGTRYCRMPRHGARPPAPSHASLHMHAF